MPSPLFHHLEFLYGDAAAPELERRTRQLLARFREAGATPPAPREGLPLTQRDALLITYADQVRAPGEPPLRTLGGFAARHLDGVVSGLHLLPFYPWSSDDGFSVKDYLAVDPACGSWDDIARIGARFDLMFDAVFNHLSAQSTWFRGYLQGDPSWRDFFIAVEGRPDLTRVVRPRALPLLTEFPAAGGVRRIWTTFSADQVDLNFHNPEVLLRVLEVLLAYVARGARFIRLDAIAFLWKEPGTTCLHLPQTHRVIQLLRTVLDEAAPQVLLITETNVPHADNVRYFGDGRNEAQLVYNFALAPLVLHALQTEDAAALVRWAQSLAPPSPWVTFFNFLASHDGIGLNPVRGILSEAEIDALVRRTGAHGGFVSNKSNPDGTESPYEMNINFLDALSDPAGGDSPAQAARKLVTAHAIMLSLQGVPGLYFHSLFGSRGDPAAVAASGIKRRINRAKLERASLERELADPGSLRSQVFSGFRTLLGIRRQQAAFAPAAPQEVLAVDPRLFAIIREAPGGGGRFLGLHNVSRHSVPVDADTLRRHGFVKRADLLTAGRNAAGGLRVEPWGTRWLRAD